MAIANVASDEQGPTRSYSTRPQQLPLPRWRRMAWGRRFLVLLFAVPIAGSIVGLVGLRHGEVRSEEAGYELRVRYPEVSRAGIASPFDMYVRHAGGFESPITLRISHDYFTLFDLNGIFPAPSAETVQDDMVVWEFDPPQGETLRVHVDWRIQPSVHRGTAAQVELVMEGRQITEVDLDTRLAP